LEISKTRNIGQNNKKRPVYMIDTILFDLDDTLIVEYQSADDSFIETLNLIETQINMNEFIKTIRRQARELWYKLPTIDYCLKVGISSWEALWADFTGENEYLKQLNHLAANYRFETWNKTLLKFNINNPDMAFKLSNEFKRIRNSKHHLYPDTLEVLKILKPCYKLGLITNGAPDLQWKKINGSNLKHYFDCIVISGEYGYGKPDPRLFYAAINGLKAGKSNTIMIGDSLDSDIKGAKDFGLKAIWINRNNDSGEIKPDYQIDNLLKIKDILNISFTAG
jgi:putative hydrolase of the HAD superfamily